MRRTSVDADARVPSLLRASLTRRDLLRRGVALGLALPAVAGLLAACGGSTDKATVTKASGAAGSPSAASGGGSTPASGGGQPVLGGKLSMSLSDQDVGNFDPIIPGDNMSIWTMLLIYDQTIRVAPDGQSIEPGLAEKWDISADGLTYTFHLRAATFHDGTVLTAQDVQYCLTRAANDQQSIWTWIFKSVDSVTAPDDKTVVSKLKKVWVPYLSDVSLYASSVYPMAAHKAQAAQLFEHPIGSGPFKFVAWEKQSKVTLAKHPDYWTKGQPYLDELNFFVLTDANTRMLQFQSGDLDIATDVPFSQLEALKQNSNVQLRQDSIARIDYIGINCQRYPDIKARQAMNYAVDKDAIIKNVLFGAGELGTTMLPKMLYWNPNVKGYPYDLTKAKQLIGESTLKDGFKAELILTLGDPVAAQVAQLVAANLKDIGGNITITQLEPAAYSAKLQPGKEDYDMYKGYFTTDIIDPDELTSLNIVSNLGGDAALTLYKNDQVDKLGVDAVSVTDPEQRKQMYYQLQELSTADAPFIFLYYPSGRTAVQNHVKNFRILPTGNYRLWETWVEK